MKECQYKITSVLPSRADIILSKSCRTSIFFLRQLKRRCTASQLARERLLSLNLETGRNTLRAALTQYGLTTPEAHPTYVLEDGEKLYQIDRVKQRSYSELLRRSKLSLTDVNRLVRGHDPRPNKALTVPDHFPC
ncbi:hypothetical protein F441_13165 [Phytophthora nicotianae CJ01A1]|uniref:Uncharacterized protein n=3 Tax=Phytophthora nicotianae TaxID=4792 RepID=V9EU17_PHYNI|nr:hypothetical protein F443_13214 [Phytophthora nicotianae P1569]ETK81612.1 hypothetical protein L915_12898 [Phytophthora nicotianae]ETM41518.1 hypothetical protein L914_12714 [Phytophthora nicotianae]ETP11308.1 hypothetical protein F441_13165 [Phytophthora nicotianae CJ01A1]